MNRTRELVMTGLLVVLLGCGGGADTGGVGTGGTGTTDSTDVGHTPKPPVATTPRETIVVAPITGFGSVFVGGVRFDDSAATISGDDGISSRQDLRLGMMAQVEGVVTGPTGQARTLRVLRAARAPVESIDPGAREVRIAGWRVLIGRDTALGNAAALSDIVPGDVIEVYGPRNDSAGTIAATRVERRPGDPTLTVTGRGEVRNADPVTRTFQVGNLTVSYGTLTLDQAPADGDVVTYLGTLGNLLAATQVRVETPSPLADGIRITVDGLVSQFVSPASFRVSDTRVDASLARITPVSSALAQDARVAITGEIRGGVLQAERVMIRGNGGPKADVDPQATGNGSGHGTGGDGSEGRTDNSTGNSTGNSSGTNAGNGNGAGAGAGAGTGTGSGSGTGAGNGNASTPVLPARAAEPVVLIGAIENFIDLTRFTVRNESVDASRAVWSGRAHAQPANGRLVEVRGTITGSVVTASRVHFAD